jgi:hypothetical protein
MNAAAIALTATVRAARDFREAQETKLMLTRKSGRRRNCDHSRTQTFQPRGGIKQSGANLFGWRHVDFKKLPGAELREVSSEVHVRT